MCTQARSHEGGSGAVPLRCFVVPRKFFFEHIMKTNICPLKIYSPPNLKTLLRACVYYVIDQVLGVTPAQCRPNFCCWVDDLFYYFLTRISSTFFLLTRTLFKVILFYKKLEINDFLDFINIFIVKSPDGFISLTHMKPTHAGFHWKWASFVSLHRKRNLTPPRIWHCGVREC